MNRIPIDNEPYLIDFLEMRYRPRSTFSAVKAGEPPSGQAGYTTSGRFSFTTHRRNDH